VRFVELGRAPAGRGLLRVGDYELIARACDDWPRMWHARHRALGRVVTLELYGEPPAELLERARAAAGSHHPNLAAVLDFGVDPTYGAFVAFALGEGETLAARLARGAVGARFGAELAERVASAVAWLHARGRTHGAVRADRLFLPSPAAAHAVQLVGLGEGDRGSDLIGLYRLCRRLDIEVWPRPHAGEIQAELRRLLVAMAAGAGPLDSLHRKR
jgi:hypothetical protein